jgi:oligoendopeptidase F
MHELGHCVEQVYTLYDMDYYTLTRVPNTAFTEAFAFVFQNKSQEILGLKKESKHDLLSPIQTFWDTREISGVALVDMYIWKWMYKKQKFTETQLREKVNEFAIDIWNKYYYPIFKVKDTPILGVYSHMIFHGLYLPDYPIGHIIAYKIEKYFRKNSIGKNMKRMCKLGKITPLKWLREAISEELEVKSLIDDVKKSVEELKIGV